MRITNVGKLRDRLTLQAPVRADDGGGGVTISWNDVAMVWGNVVAKTGREAVEGGRLSGSVSHEITIRYRYDAKPTMRFQFDGRIFEILALLHPTGKRDWLTCLCVERDL